MVKLLGTAPRGMYTSVLCVVLCVAGSVLGQNRFLPNRRQNGRRLQNQMFTNGQQQRSQIFRHPQSLHIIPLESNSFLISKSRSRSNYAQLVLTGNAHSKYPRERNSALVVYPLNAISSNRLSLHDILTGRSSRLRSRTAVGLDSLRRIRQPRVRIGKIVFMRRRLRPNNGEVAGDPTIRLGRRMRLKPRLKVIYLGDETAKTRFASDPRSLIREVLLSERQQNDIFTKQTPRNIQIVRLNRRRQTEGSRRKAPTGRDANLIRTLMNQRRKQTKLQFPYPQNRRLSRFRSSRRQIPARNKLTNSLKHIARLSGRSNSHISMYPSQDTFKVPAQIQQAQIPPGSKVDGNSVMPANTIPLVTSSPVSNLTTVNIDSNIGVNPTVSAIFTQPMTNQLEYNPITGSVQPATSKISPRIKGSRLSDSPEMSIAFVQSANTQGESKPSTGTVQPSTNNMMYPNGMGSKHALPVMYEHRAIIQTESNLNGGSAQSATNTKTHPDSMGAMLAFANSGFINQRAKAVSEMRFKNNLVTGTQSGSTVSQTPTNSEALHLHTSNPKQNGFVRKPLSLSPTPSSEIPGILAKTENVQPLHGQQNPIIDYKNTRIRPDPSLQVRTQTSDQFMHTDPLKGAKLVNLGIDPVNRDYNVVNPNPNTGVNFAKTGTENHSPQSAINKYLGIQQQPRQNATAAYLGVKGQSGQSATSLHPGIQYQINRRGNDVFSGVQRQRGKPAPSVYPGIQQQVGQSASSLYAGDQNQVKQNATRVYSGGQSAINLYSGVQKQLAQSATGLYSGVQKQLAQSATGLYPGIQRQPQQGATSLYPGARQQMALTDASLYPGGNVGGGINAVHPAVLRRLQPAATSLGGLVSQHPLSNGLFQGNPLLGPQVGTMIKPSLLMPKGGVVSKVSGGEMEVVAGDGRRVKLEGGKLMFE